MEPTVQQQLFRGIRVLLVLAAITLVFYYVVPLISPFIFGWIVAYLLNPLVNLLQRRARFPRWAAVAVALLLFFGTAAVLLAFIITNITIEIGSFTSTIQDHINKWKDDFINYINSDYVQNLLNKFNTFLDENPQYHNTINSNVTSTANKLADLGSVIISAIVSFFVYFVTSLPRYATLIIFGLLASFFISKDWHKLIGRASAFFPSNVKKTTRVVWADLQKALFGYVRAQLILITLTAVVVLLGLIILNVKYAITISLLTGFCDLLPYLGTGFVMAPWIVYVFLQHNVYLGVGLSILYGIILIVRQTIEPKVLATSIGLNSLATLFAMFVGLQVFGVLGLAIGPVTLIVLKAFYKANVFRDLYLYVKLGSIPE